MSLFKKEKKQPALLSLLYDAYKRAREDGKTSFYYALFDNEKKYAEDFCKKNRLHMVVDHITDGNVIYKFMIGD